MIKKTLCLALLSLILASPGYASYEGRSNDGALQRSGTVFKRGILNIVGFPAELYSSTKREMEMHPKAWPVTVLPRTITNLITRGASAVHDTLISPIFQAPFTSDISPMTEPMGLPDYPWQVES